MRLWNDTEFILAHKEDMLTDLSADLEVVESGM